MVVLDGALYREVSHSAVDTGLKKREIVSEALRLWLDRSGAKVSR